MNLFELQNLQKLNEKNQLWTPPFSFGLHPCVKPTPRYKGNEKSYISLSAGLILDSVYELRILL